jgi:hypothetical protein
MNNNIQNLIHPIQNQGQIRNDKDNDSSTEVEQNYCSLFILEKCLLVKGEGDKPEAKKRKAVVEFRDGITGDIIGKTRVDMIINSFGILL